MIKFFKNGYFTIRDLVTIGRHPECKCTIISLFITHPILPNNCGWVCDCEKTWCEIGCLTPNQHE